MSRRKVSTTIYAEPAQMEALQALCKRTGVPMAVYIRQGIAAVLRANEGTAATMPDVLPDHVRPRISKDTGKDPMGGAR